MKFPSIVSESWRDIVSGTTRAITCAVILFAVALTACLFDLTSILAMQEQSRQWLASGAAIHIIAGDKQIDPADCNTLTQATGSSERTTAHPITATGALRQTGSITLSAMSSSPLDAWNATPGMADVLGISMTRQAATGVWISSQLAQTLHAREGDDLATAHGSMHIAGVFAWPDDSRDQRIAYAILIPTASSGPYDECWATITPDNPDAASLLNATAVATPGSAPATQTKQANAALGSNLDLAASYRQRATRTMLCATPITAMLIAIVSLRARRIEIADNLHMGLPRQDIWKTQAIETLAWSLPALLGAAAAIYPFTAIVSGRSNALTLTATQLPLLSAALATAQIGTLMAMASIQTKQLFAFFKNRQ